MSLVCSYCSSNNRDGAVFCATCGFKLAQVHAGPFDPGTGHLLPNTVLDGRYRVVRTLGGGGMGTVYLAEDSRLGHIACAVKEMTDAFTNPADRQYAVQRFQTEALMLAKLRHPRIPRVTNHFLEHGRYYLVMDYVEGESLEHVLTREGRPGLLERQVLEWTQQILEVLEYLHGQNPPAIFRDLKPANVMRRKADDSVVLIDFGIARLFVPTRAGTVIGTPGYAPPEQYQGLAEPRSDLYSLGATMHHLLTGRDPRLTTPFTFPPLRSLNGSLSLSVEAVVTTALSFRVEDRFASAHEMRRVLLSLGDVVVPMVEECLPSLTPGTVVADRFEIVELLESDADVNLYSTHDLAICPMCRQERDQSDNEYCTECGVALELAGHPVLCKLQEALSPEAIAANPDEGMFHNGRFYLPLS